MVRERRLVSKRESSSFIAALPPLFLVILVLGWYFCWVFFYRNRSLGNRGCLRVLPVCFLVYRQVKLKEIPEILLQCGITTAVVMLLIGTSMAMSWVLAFENIPQNISAGLLGLTDNTIIILLIINFVAAFLSERLWT